MDNATLAELSKLVGQLASMLGAGAQSSAPEQPTDPALDEDTISDEDLQDQEADHRDPETPEGAVTKDTDPTEDEDSTNDEDPVSDEDSVEDEDETADEDTVGDEDPVSDEDCTQDDDEILAKALAAVGAEVTPEKIAALRDALAGPAIDGAQDSGAAVKRALRAAGKRRPKAFAMDAATFNTRIKRAVALGEKAALNKMRRLTTAANQCAPILGRVNPINFDSAGAIYQAAAVQAGMSEKAARDPKVARGYVMAALKMQRNRPVSVAMDSAPRDNATKSVLTMLDNKRI